jgi:hypothetical protein
MAMQTTTNYMPLPWNMICGTGYYYGSRMAFTKMHEPRTSQCMHLRSLIHATDIPVAIAWLGYVGYIYPNCAAIFYQTPAACIAIQ